MIDLVRLREACPLPNRMRRGSPRAVRGISALGPAPLRTGCGPIIARRRSAHLLRASAPNVRKRGGGCGGSRCSTESSAAWSRPVFRRGRRTGSGGLADWMGPARREPFVFVVSGRNVPPGRLRRCLESMIRQKGPTVGGGALRRCVGAEDRGALRGCLQPRSGRVARWFATGTAAACWPTR